MQASIHKEMNLEYTKGNAEQILHALMFSDEYLASCYCLHNSCLCLQQRMWPPYATKCFSSTGNLYLGMAMCKCTHITVLTHLKGLCHKLAGFEDLNQQEAQLSVISNTLVSISSIHQHGRAGGFGVSHLHQGVLLPRPEWKLLDQ